MADSAEGSKPNVVRASDYKAFYTNHAQVGYTAFDIFVVLSEAASDYNGELLIEQRGRITMSPPQAVLLSHYLINAVKIYEEASGKKVEVPQFAHEEDAVESGQGTV